MINSIKLNLSIFIIGVQLLLGTSCVESTREEGKLESLQDKSLVELVKILRPDFLLGTHTNVEHMTSSPENKKPQEIISEEYNMVSAGIYMRRTQHKSRDDWKFDSVDPIVDFAMNNDLKVYLHPMYGSNNYLEKWLREGNYSDEELLEIIEERIKKILTRYKGKVHILDVYNEGLDRSKQEWREKDNLFLSMGYHENEYGKWPVFLEKILLLCRKYGGEDLKLIYNDNHNTLLGMSQSLECVKLFKALKHEGIPIDGIGIQCHTKINKKGQHMLSGSKSAVGPLFDVDLFAKNLRNMGEAGIDVYISESDVHLYGQIDDKMLELQAQAYRSILKACIEEPACKSFKTWGFTDASCWNPNKDKKIVSKPMPFDDEYNPKPAYSAMKDLLIELIENK